jgi:hypothetical protein
MSESDNNEPTIQELAQASEGAYAQSKKGNLTSRHEAGQATGPKDYTLQPQWTDKHMSTYKHNAKDHYIIAHRGTDLHGEDVKKDLTADWALLTNQHTNDKTFVARKNRTEKILKQIPSSESKVYLTGHSLGDSTVNHTLLNSKKTRDRIENAHTFNIGSSPIAGKVHNTKIKEELRDKLTHHKIEQDPLSSSSTGLGGKVKVYKSTKSIPSIGLKMLKHIKPLLEKSAVGKLASMSGEYLLTSLQRHSLKNFTQ